jgi:hypothetical protein
VPKDARNAGGNRGKAAVSETCIALVARMVVNIMAGERERVLELYEEYNRERYLFVTIGEILRQKRRG